MVGRNSGSGQVLMPPSTSDLSWAVLAPQMETLPTPVLSNKLYNVLNSISQSTVKHALLCKNQQLLRNKYLS